MQESHAHVGTAAAPQSSQCSTDTPGQDNAKGCSMAATAPELHRSCWLSP